MIMERKVTFLFSTGRCGSTLAQRLINSSPETIIWGEHDGFLGPISDSYFRLLNSKNIDKISYQNPGKFSPINIIKQREKICQSEISWMNNFTKDKLRDNYKNFVELVFCDELPESISCWGFKEIRYGLNSNDSSINMLIDFFPKSRNLIIVRNPLDTIVSMVTAWNPHLVDECRNSNETDQLKNLVRKRAIKWSNQNKNLLTYTQKFPDNFMVVKYEEFEQEFEKSVFDFIGLDCPENIHKVLAKNVWQTKTGKRSSFVRDFIHSIGDCEFWKNIELVASDLDYSIKL